MRVYALCHHTHTRFRVHAGLAQPGKAAALRQGIIDSRKEESPECRAKLKCAYEEAVHVHIPVRTGIFLIDKARLRGRHDLILKRAHSGRRHFIRAL